jgi:hypothetical protein
MAVIIPVSLVAAFAPINGADAISKSPIKLEPIVAVFEQNFYRTEYITALQVPTPAASAGLDITWKLKLELVDKAGAPDPEMTASGLSSGAAVDPGCTNHGVLEQTDHVTKSELDAHKGVASGHFLWHHPDPLDSDPAGWYHCNHMLQGPHGHQGLITVVVSYGSWSCSATFKGTHSSLFAPLNKPNPDVTNGTASEPMCFKI